MPGYLEVDFTITLMRWDAEMQLHVATDELHWLYYFHVPDDWLAAPRDLERRCLSIAQTIYAAHNARLQADEPDDLNYLSVTAVQPVMLTPLQVAEQPWLTAPNRAYGYWEWTPCVAVVSEDSYRMVPPEAFAEATAEG